MPASNYFYDTFVVQKYSELTAVNAEPLGVDFPSYQYWLTHFVLNSTFRSNPTPDQRAVAFALLRRAEGAVEEFDQACMALADFVSVQRTVSGYFRALRRFESAVAQVHQAFQFMKQASGTPFFRTKDGSHYQRLNEVYNVGRHGNPTALPPGHVQLVWLENDGIHVASGVLAFEELRDLVAELARAADYIASGGPWTQPAPP